MTARTVDGRVRVVFEDGSWGDADVAETAERVSTIVGEDVTLAREGAVAHHDAGPVHLITTSSLAWLQRRLPGVVIDRRRFRPNVVLACDGEDLVEEQWVGRSLVIGSATLTVERRTVRCVTPSLSQQDLAFAPSIPRELERLNDLCLGMYASVATPGRIQVGDEVHGRD